MIQCKCNTFEWEMTKPSFNEKCPIGDKCRIKRKEKTVSCECGSWFCIISDFMDQRTSMKDQATEERGANNFNEKLWETGE